MRMKEWMWLKANHQRGYSIALERRAVAAGNAKMGGLIRKNLAEAMGEDDRCSFCIT